jgi:hypothetical protein
VDKPEGKSSVGRPKSRWEDNIKIDVKEMDWKGLDAIHRAHATDGVLGSCEHSN